MCLFALPLFFSIGCQTVLFETYFPDAYIYSRWIPPIADAETPRSQIIDQLGNPSRSYEDGRIAVYRIVVHPWRSAISDRQYEMACANKYRSGGMFEKGAADAYFKQLDTEGLRLVVTTANEELYRKEIIASSLEFHLILIYDGTGVVRRHGLIRQQP